MFWWLVGTWCFTEDSMRAPIATLWEAWCGNCSCRGTEDYQLADLGMILLGSPHRRCRPSWLTMTKPCPIAVYMKPFWWMTLWKLGKLWLLLFSCFFENVLFQSFRWKTRVFEHMGLHLMPKARSKALSLTSVWRGNHLFKYNRRLSTSPNKVIMTSLPVHQAHSPGLSCNPPGSNWRRHGWKPLAQYQAASQSQGFFALCFSLARQWGANNSWWFVHLCSVVVHPRVLLLWSSLLSHHLRHITWVNMLRLCFA